jgi:hypothetical protein
LQGSICPATPGLVELELGPVGIAIGLLVGIAIGLLVGIAIGLLVGITTGLLVGITTGLLAGFTPGVVVAVGTVFTSTAPPAQATIVPMTKATNVIRISFIAATSGTLEFRILHPRFERYTG